MTQRRRRERQQQLRLGRALAPRTGDESARFHSKESPRPPPRSTSGFTAPLRLPFPRRPIEDDSGVERASQEERPGQTTRAPCFRRPGLEGGAEVSARAAPTPPTSSLLCPHLSLPSSARPAGAEMELQECERRNPFLRFGVHRGPTSKLKGSLELRLTWSSEKQERKGRGVKRAEVGRMFFSIVQSTHLLAFTNLQRLNFKENKHFPSGKTIYFKPNLIYKV